VLALAFSVHIRCTDRWRRIHQHCTSIPIVFYLPNCIYFTQFAGTSQFHFNQTVGNVLLCHLLQLLAWPQLGFVLA
jgi:hypothetical protein